MKKKLFNEEKTSTLTTTTFIIITTYLTAILDLIVSDNINSPGTKTSCSCGFGPN